MKHYRQLCSRSMVRDVLMGMLFSIEKEANSVSLQEDRSTSYLNKNSNPSIGTSQFEFTLTNATFLIDSND